MPFDGHLLTDIFGQFWGWAIWIVGFIGLCIFIWFYFGGHKK